LTIELPFEVHHNGVRVTLVGIIVNKSSEMYYGAGKALGGMLTGGAKYEFIKLSRELEGPGSL